MTTTETRQLDPDPLPARPLPHELAVVPADELAHTASVYANSLDCVTYADGTPIPAETLATHALYGLAAGAVALQALARHMLALAEAARAAGASAHEIRARVPEAARVAMAFTPAARPGAR